MSKSKEQPHRRPRSELAQAFGFSEREESFSQVSDRRLRGIIEDEVTTVHEVLENYNNYGEWLFVTVSRPVGDRRISVSFYGQGFHEYRERWFTDRWFWYQANNFPERLAQELDKEDVRRLIEERQATIASYVTDQPPSARAELFSMLADLTDEDGAYVELEDLGEAADWLLGDDGEG